MSAPMERAALEKALKVSEDRWRGDSYVTGIPCEDWSIVQRAARAYLDTIPRTKMAWIVIETAYGKTTGWRHFEHLDAALTTASKWVSQSVGDITIGRREVPA